MSEMIDRISTILRSLPVRDSIDPNGELDKLRSREAARAVLAAMRTPTAEMLNFGVGNKDAKLTWELMIDALLQRTN